MAQHDYIISNATFPAVRTDINNALSAIQTTNSGTSRPTGAVAGQIWLDTTNATSPTLKFYDGADDISLATINYTTNTVDWLDSSITITGLSTTATGTVLTLSDTANTTTQNLIIDNQKEVRFRETTANGTNYVALKAPANVSADLTFTLPATDGSNGQALITNGSGVLSFTTVSADGTADWDTTVKTSGFTATANKGYFCNTTSGGFTVTLPSTPSAGDEIIILDYAGTFDTNALVISPNGKKIESSTLDQRLTGDRESIRLVYIDSTQGWIGVSGFQEGTDGIAPNIISVDYLVVAGGGGGGYNQGGGGGAGGYRSGTDSAVIPATNYTVTVGGGGAGGIYSPATIAVAGSNSVFGSITSAGGGIGGRDGGAGGNGGSGGGGAGNPASGAGGTGNTPSTSPSQGNNGGTGTTAGPAYAGGGGGGASAVGANASGSAGGAGGAGTASSITGSSVTRAGGGGGGSYTTAGAGGTGGGGAGGSQPAGNTGTAGTTNRGGGGGGGSFGTGGAGGSGIVILKYPDTFTISNSGGGLTFSTSTSGGFKVTSFTAGTGTIQFN